MKHVNFGITLTTAMALLVSMPVLLHPAPASAQLSVHEASDKSDRQILIELSQELDASRFRNVQVSVANGVVSLAGSVEIFADKEAAAKKALHAKKAIAIRDDIRVIGTKISDEDLQAKLVKKLELDRVGYGTTTFNAISVGVQEGVVTLGGHAYSPTDKYSALSVASYLPGVQDVIDEIEVDPPSPMDDRIRLNVARLVYGYPALSKYAIDPARPIRISVQNGHVTLYGLVDSEADRNIANIRANGVQGVFSVTNALQVENAVSERN